MSLHADTDAASCPLDWRLFIPDSWDDTCAGTNEGTEQVAERRTRAGIPDTVRHRTKWAQALEMIDEATTWGLVPPTVIADAGYGEITAFRHGLTDRDIRYVLAVKSTTTAHLATDTPERLSQTPGKGRPCLPRYRDKPASLQGLARSAGRKALHQVTWRHGTKPKPDNRGAAMKSRFMALRIRPANRDIPRAGDGSLPEAWMLAEWPVNQPAPTDYWISDLPAETPLKDLVRLAKMRWRIEHDYRELKQELGLSHFEGRSFNGWHRHVTLVTAAHLFITKLRLEIPKATGAA